MYVKGKEYLWNVWVFLHYWWWRGCLVFLLGMARALLIIGPVVGVQCSTHCFVCKMIIYPVTNTRTSAAYRWWSVQKRTFLCRSASKQWFRNIEKGKRQCGLLFYREGGKEVEINETLNNKRKEEMTWWDEIVDFVVKGHGKSIVLEIQMLWDHAIQSSSKVVFFANCEFCVTSSQSVG